MPCVWPSLPRTPVNAVTLSDFVLNTVDNLESVELQEVFNVEPRNDFACLRF